MFSHHFIPASRVWGGGSYANFGPGSHTDELGGRLLDYLLHNANVLFQSSHSLDSADAHLVDSPPIRTHEPRRMPVLVDERLSRPGAIEGKIPERGHDKVSARRLRWLNRQIMSEGIRTIRSTELFWPVPHRLLTTLAPVSSSRCSIPERVARRGAHSALCAHWRPPLRATHHLIYIHSLSTACSPLLTYSLLESLLSTIYYSHSFQQERSSFLPCEGHLASKVPKSIASLKREAYTRLHPEPQ